MISGSRLSALISCCCGLTKRVEALEGAPAGGTGDMLRANNLSDVLSAPTSRTNLGLGTGNTPQFLGLNLGGTNLRLSSLGAGSLLMGLAPSAIPVSQTLTIGESVLPGGSNNDIAGANGTIRCGLGTGASLPNVLQFQTATPGSAGSAQQVYATRLQLNSNGASLTGTLTCSSNISIGVGASLFWPNRSILACPSDGIIQMSNFALNDFNRLQLGGTTNAFPAIKRSLGTIQFRLADDSQDCPIKCQNITVSDNANMIKSSVAFASGAAAAAGTLTNAPVAGNPTKWIGINDAGTVRYIPAW